MNKLGIASLWQGSAQPGASHVVEYGGRMRGRMTKMIREMMMTERQEAVGEELLRFVLCAWMAWKAC